MMEPTSSSTSRSYLDFDGLGQLKGQARQDAKSATRETAQQFEALFLQMTMKSMRDTIMKSDLSEDKTIETYESMFDKEVSVQLAKRNSLGLADMLVRNLESQQANIATTAEILKQRQDSATAPSAKGLPLQPVLTGMPLSQKSSAQQMTLPKSTGAIPLNFKASPIPGGHE
jgi:Rod binding domain-containing protein